MVPFKSLGAVPYWHLIVAMALFCIIFEIKLDIGQKSQFFIPMYSVPHYGGPCWNIAIPVGTEKLEWHGYTTEKV